MAKLIKQQFYAALMTDTAQASITVEGAPKSCNQNGSESFTTAH